MGQLRSRVSISKMVSSPESLYLFRFGISRRIYFILLDRGACGCFLVLSNIFFGSICDDDA
jgi:hypothetical protein